MLQEEYKIVEYTYECLKFEILLQAQRAEAVRGTILGIFSIQHGGIRWQRVGQAVFTWNHSWLWNDCIKKEIRFAQSSGKLSGKLRFVYCRKGHRLTGENGSFDIAIEYEYHIEQNFGSPRGHFTVPGEDL